MKKITLLFALIVGFVFVTNAQEKGKIRIGVGLALGTKSAIDTDGEKAGIGINFGGEYFVTDIISIAPSYTTFFKSDLDILGSNNSLKLSVLNIDGRYYFNTDGPQFYGLVGIAFLTGKAESSFLGSNFSVSDNETGLNIGGGVVIPISDKLGFNGQIKYQTPGEGQLVINGGIVFSVN